MNALISLPERGMGYQRVDFTLTDGREIKNVLVVNAEYISHREVTIDNVASLKEAAR